MHLATAYLSPWRNLRHSIFVWSSIQGQLCSSHSRSIEGSQICLRERGPGTAKWLVCGAATSAMVAADGWKQRCGMTFGITALVWLALLGLSALDPRVHARAGLLPPGAAAAAAPPPPKSVPYRLPLDQLGSPDIPLDDPRLKKVVGPEEPEQIHLALAGTPEALLVRSMPQRCKHVKASACVRN